MSSKVCGPVNLSTSTVASSKPTALHCHPGLPANRFPEVYFSGSSAAAVAAAGLHSDYYLSWLEPYADLRAKIDNVRENSAKLGRTPKFAVRIDVVARHTEEAAWAEIEKGWAFVDKGAADRAAPG